MTSFHWTETAEACAPFLFELGWELDDGCRHFTRDGLRIHPPLVFPIEPGTRSLAHYVLALPDEPGRHTVVLMQAGAVSLGLFEAGEPIATRSNKRYVVRGSGRAQPTHLKTKGKSRYGSRLRLQNAKLLLEETNEKLLEWESEHGPSDCVYYNAPVRLWPTLFEVTPAPPFTKEDRAIKIPRDLPKPTTEILLRAYRGLCYGRVEEL
jgi:Bacteroidetes VLRF1 release factor